MGRSRPLNGPFSSPHKKAVFFLLATAFLWSLGGILIKWVEWNPLAIAGTRSLIALPLLFFCFKPFTLPRDKDTQAGALAYAVTVILFVTATKLTTAANAILLQYTSPVYVAILGAWWLKEKTRRTDWILLVFSLSGIFLFFRDQLTTEGFWGNICALGSGLSFAFLILFLRKQKDGSPIGIAFWGNVLTGILCIPFLFQTLPNAESWAGLAILGTLQLGLPYYLFSKAIRHVTAMDASMIPMLEPLLNPVWVFLFLGEFPGPWAMAGGCLVLGTVAVRCVLALQPQGSGK